ncbi:hypothetical protein BP6252_13098 [Coleophoma cylindrospora]|uniref:Transcription factor domain-containing protein n=1 Tax=Coleophoma cylindrospora TaxID=1849047 RepID=A0A3D8Q9U6_9HELO|nr:hypothetical protein BP6252_13098 [Coleophoma cylindrospora]
MTRSPIIRNPTTQIFQDDQEHRYFSSFYTSTAYEITGYFIYDIFSQLVPQSCYHQPYFSKAVVAIGALQESIRISNRESQQRFSLDALEDTRLVQHRHYALQRYNEALSLMRRGFVAGRYGRYLRNVLIFCILVSYFEAIHNNQETCNTQIQIGIKILLGWLETSRPDKRALALAGIASPSPGLIENDILTAYVRLYRQTMHSSPRMPQWSFPIEEAEVLGKMPERFSSIREARTYWELLDRCKVNFLAAYDPNTLKPGDSQITFRPLNCPPGEVPIIVQNHVAFMRKWCMAIAPFLQESSEEDNISDFLAAATHLVKTRVSAITYTAMFSPDETIFDNYQDEYNQIHALSKKILHVSDSAFGGENAPGMFDEGLILSLCQVVVLCRDRALRREILQTCRDFVPREGLLGWQNDISMSIGQWVVEHEEAGLLDEVRMVPQDARIRIYSIQYSLGHRQGVLLYNGGRAGVYDSSVAQEREIGW